MSEPPGPLRGGADGGTIVVSGTGRVAVAPDVADLRLGVAVERATVEEARATAAGAMASVLGAALDAGVDGRDVRTTLLSVQPRYDYREGKAPALVGYALANLVEVTVRDLARLGSVVDGALTAGATSLDALTFRVDDPREAERTARTAAVTEARSRAEVLAAAAGVSITGVHEIVEGGPQPGWPLPKSGRMALAAEQATPVEGGTTDIAVTVTVTFRTS